MSHPTEISTISLARELVRIPSVTPNDRGCQSILSEHLQKLGFTVESLKFGDVDNLWARLGHKEPLFVFAGHTDVVPSGPQDDWHHQPFSGDVIDGYLHGRGAADMKGSLAAMIISCQRFLHNHPNPQGSIGFLITSDEEGEAVDGTKKVLEVLHKRGEKIHWCVLGEPTSHEQVGDTVKIGRRGSMTGRLRIIGKQGHVAYPHLADNPAHRIGRLIDALTSIEWDKGSEEFPPTSFQISNIHAGTGAGNVIPGEVEILFNFRFSPEITTHELQQRVITICEKLDSFYEIDWTIFGYPFRTPHGAFTEAISAAIKQITGHDTEFSTTGGTSDGRFIAPTGAEVIELGPVNATIHKVNECVSVDDLELLSLVYEQILVRLLADD